MAETSVLERPQVGVTIDVVAISAKAQSPMFQDGLILVDSCAQCGKGFYVAGDEMERLIQSNHIQLANVFRSPYGFYYCNAKCHELFTEY